MTFRVQFPRPVVYQPGHPTHEQIVTELIVAADDAEGAGIHATRVCSGDVRGLTVEPYQTMLTPPPVESTPDIPICIEV